MCLLFYSLYFLTNDSIAEFLKEIESKQLTTTEETKYESKQPDTTEEIKQIEINAEILPLVKCSCKKEKLFIKSEGKNFILQKQLDNQNTLIGIERDTLVNAKCDLYNVLRRGENQKVIGYSLYGQNSRYYKHIETLVRLNSEIYPDWIMRIYYDNSIDKSIICQLECMKNDKDEYFNNIDFCYLNSIPYGLPDLVKTKWNASYMHLMMTRWLPIADPFVDYFISRDLDAIIGQREKDSVDAWINSKTLFHIMRGNSIEILFK